MNVAVFDGSMINLTVQNGWKGVEVVNGCITNTNGVQQVQFGIKAIGSCNSRGYQNLGQRGVTLSFGNVNFTPGSWIYADQSSVAVSPNNMVGGTTLPMGNSVVSGGATNGIYGGEIHMLILFQRIL